MLACPSALAQYLEEEGILGKPLYMYGVVNRDVTDQLVSQARQNTNVQKKDRGVYADSFAGMSAKVAVWEVEACIVRLKGDDGPCFRMRCKCNSSSCKGRLYTLTELVTHRGTVPSKNKAQAMEDKPAVANDNDKLSIKADRARQAPGQAVYMHRVAWPDKTWCPKQFAGCDFLTDAILKVIHKSTQCAVH